MVIPSTYQKRQNGWMEVDRLLDFPFCMFSQSPVGKIIRGSFFMPDSSGGLSYMVDVG